MINTTTSTVDPTSSSDGGKNWFEDVVLGGFRVWQLAGIVLSILLALIVGLCCCYKFRIPRTKQEIEADYIRKKITKNFHKELAKIDNADMDEMDLRKALERVRDGLEEENVEPQKRQDGVHGEKSSEGLGARFQAMVHAIRLRFAKDAPSLPKTRIIVPSDSEA